MNDINKSWLILPGLIISVASILLLTAYGHKEMTEMRERFYDLGQNAYRKRFLISEFEKGVVDMEAGERGYLITGLADFLTPYHEAQKKLAATHEEIHRYFESDNPRLCREMQICWELAQRWITEVAEPEIAMRDAVSRGALPGSDLAKLAMEETGKGIMDDIRLHVEQIEKILETEQKKQLTTLESLNHKLVTHSWLLAAAMVLIVGLVEWFAFVNLRRLEETRTKLSDHETKLKATVLELREATRIKSEFLANMSHEIRTPLNAILGFAQILGKETYGPLNEKQQGHLGYIQSGGRHLLSLINDVLDLSKVEAGKMELELSTFPLARVFQASLDLFREKARKHRIDLDLECDEQGLTVTADERKIRQVLYNLLSNALKFTPDGGRVRLAAAASESFATISVTDSGIGISPEEQEIIFEPFRQADGSYTRKFEGTGLGLSLVKRFVELHGGKISVQSNGPGQGSVFSFTLPFKDHETRKEDDTHETGLDC